MRGRLVLSALFLAAAAGAACSDDGGGADEDAYVDALAEELQSNEENPLEEEDATCVAEGSIQALGADNLEDAGITPDDVAAADGPQDLDMEISADQARAAAESFVDCDLPFGEAFLGADGPADGIRCIDENLDGDALIEAYTAQYLGNDDEADERFAGLFTSLQEECGEFLGG